MAGLDRLKFAPPSSKRYSMMITKSNRSIAQLRRQSRPCPRWRSGPSICPDGFYLLPAIRPRFTGAASRDRRWQLLWIFFCCTSKIRPLVEFYHEWVAR